jgi:hypothetical protein
MLSFDMYTARWWVAGVLLGAVGCTTGGEAPDGGLIPLEAGMQDSGPRYDAYVPPPDAGPTGWATLGERCIRHVDCDTGYCVDPGGGGVCSRPCSAGCPDRWHCREVDLGDERTSLCIPLDSRNCARCASDEECLDGACVTLDGERRCVGVCTGDVDCPTGYRCSGDPDGTREGRFCVPRTGSCSCESAMAGASRSCSVASELGTCWGTQTCQAETGWTACSASAPASEVCDGVDNDCNFLIDDGVGPGEPCERTVAGIGTCRGVTACMGEAGFVCQAPTPRTELCNYVDDDCDGRVDETFPTLGDLCQSGVGACVRFGAVRCRADGTATECSASAAPASAERCNASDDDCDGRIDETFPNLGQLCTAGVGACARFGTTVCRTDGASDTCSATPGPSATETCNYLDDDCNGVVDDGFRNAATGRYDRDTACGACDIDCTALYGSTAGSLGRCAVVGGSPGCVLGCVPGRFDLNGSALDGCEFVLGTTAIYVSGGDPMARDDASCGLGPSPTGQYPCRTIGQGLARAAATGRRQVLVADGTYDEAVTLRNGIDLLGGHRPDTWVRNVETTATVIQGSSAAGVHERTVIASGISSATVFEGFVVVGPFNSRPGGNSYAVYVSSSSSALVLRNNFIYGGRGGTGATGALGANGATGVDGIGRDSPGVSAADYDARTTSGSGTCNTSNNRQYANGGARSCGTDDVSGGRGGGNSCPVATDQTQRSAANGVTGQPGVMPGGGAAGAAGAGGWDGTLATSGTRCVVPTSPAFGANGAAGDAGADADAVVGCSSPAGAVVGGHWQANAGAVGLAGRNGGGGGGGGAGGGAYCLSCSGSRDRLGAHGGGGGSGGCGGSGGGAGQSGGGVFGIFIVGGSAPVVTNNVIVRGDAGGGGAGGQGGAGGTGGTGGAGGRTDLFCTGAGGRGGDGGSGGHGSGGGGGCGGSSFGIYTSGIGTPTYCAAMSNVVTGGASGPAGAGGFSAGRSGGAGQPGLLVDCSFN